MSPFPLDGLPDGGLSNTSGGACPRGVLELLARHERVGLQGVFFVDQASDVVSLSLFVVVVVVVFGSGLPEMLSRFAISVPDGKIRCGHISRWWLRHHSIPFNRYSSYNESSWTMSIISRICMGKGEKTTHQMALVPFRQSRQISPRPVTFHDQQVAIERAQI